MLAMLPPRSSYTASQSYTWAHWTGDPSSDWYEIHTQHTSTYSMYIVNGNVCTSSTKRLIALFCRSFASGLPAQITASLNIGLSGMPFSGSDIGERYQTCCSELAYVCTCDVWHVSFWHTGGFEWYVDVPPTLELWARWTQAGCFSGLMHEQGRLGGPGLLHGAHLSQQLVEYECMACVCCTRTYMPHIE